MVTRVAFLALAAGLATAHGQSQRPPYAEGFESAAVPALPAGWETSFNRSASGDFATTASAVYAGSVAVLSSNATVEQWLFTPPVDFTALIADSLCFHERRSGTHNASLLLEASLDGGSSFPVLLADTLRNTGTTAYIRRSVKLPDTLDGQADVRFRFRVAGDGTGATGTLRFDDVLITARATVDAAIERIAFTPPVPNAGDSVAVTATVRNAGIGPLGTLLVGFYADRDGDGILNTDERFGAEASADTLPPLASIDFTARLGGLAAGRTPVTAVVASPGDAMAGNDTLEAILGVGMRRGAAVANELMYAPVPGGAEWLELANTTDTVISLRDWRVSNRNTASRYLITPVDVPLPRAALAVVTKDTALFRLVHPGAGTSVIAATTLPTFLFNNAGDAVVLFDSSGAVIDSVHYLPSWGGQEGRSLERIEPSGPSLDPLNWGSSEDSSGSTPGVINSLTPLDSNLQLRRIGAVINADGSAGLSALVRNAGRTAAEHFTVALYLASEGVPWQLVAEAASQGPLGPGDTAVLAGVWSEAPPGRHRVSGVLSYAPDMRSSDDRYIASVDIPFRPASVVINEIMFDPLPGEAEFVELFNRSGDTVDMEGWQLTDRRDAGDHRLTDSSCLLPPGDYLVAAGDSSVFTRYGTIRAVVPASLAALNNSGDELVLIDRTGTAIDSLRYDPSWHLPFVDDPSGRSLERISPDLPSADRRNWGTCAGPLGGTPGARNSLQTPLAPAPAAVSCFPNPFSPDGDGLDDVTVIAYNLPVPSALIRLRIFDSVGRPVRLLADGEPSGPRGSLVWDGSTDRRDRAAIGLYILLLEALDGSGSELERAKGVVVVAGRL